MAMAATPAQAESHAAFPPEPRMAGASFRRPNKPSIIARKNTTNGTKPIRTANGKPSIESVLSKKTVRLPSDVLRTQSLYTFFVPEGLFFHLEARHRVWSRMPKAFFQFWTIYPPFVATEPGCWPRGGLALE